MWPLTPSPPLACIPAGQAKQLERWLRLGGNPSALDRQGGRGTLLHAAVQGDSLSCVKVSPACSIMAASCCGFQLC